VSEDDFRANLTAMVRAARAAGVVAVLVTAPTAHVEGGPLPTQMGRWLRRPEDLIPLHRRYAEIVRETARAEGAPLCDVAEEIRALPRTEDAPAWFMADGIHLTPEGADVFGGLLYDDFARLGLLGPLMQ
jgi:lysophospholipase L1-like esterase